MLMGFRNEIVKDLEREQEEWLVGVITVPVTCGGRIISRSGSRGQKSERRVAVEREKMMV